MALYMTIVMGGTPIGSPIIGWVGETFGPRWTLLGGGALVIVGVALAVALFGRSSGTEVSVEPEGVHAQRGVRPQAAVRLAREPAYLVLARGRHAE